MLIKNKLGVMSDPLARPRICVKLTCVWSWRICQAQAPGLVVHVRPSGFLGLIVHVCPEVFQAFPAWIFWRKTKHDASLAALLYPVHLSLLVLLQSCWLSTRKVGWYYFPLIYTLSTWFRHYGVAYISCFLFQPWYFALAPETNAYQSIFATRGPSLLCFSAYTFLTSCLP